MDSQHDSPPDGYVEPFTVWDVEGVHPSEPEKAVHFGAFTVEGDAEALMQRLEREDFFSDVRINVISVHRRLVDYDWDR